MSDEPSDKLPALKEARLILASLTDIHQKAQSLPVKFQPRDRLLFSLKPLLLSGYLCTCIRPALERAEDLGTSPALLIYLALFVALSACLVASAYIHKAALRRAYAVLFFIAAVFANSFEWITASQLTYDSFINLVNSLGFLDEAIAQYSGKMGTAAAFGMLLLFGVGLQPQQITLLPSYVLSAFPSLGLAMLVIMLFARGGDGAKALPAPYQSLAYATLLAYERMIDTVGPRRAVTFPAPVEPAPNDIVLLVDESVSPIYLDIVNPAGVETGLNNPRANVRIFNYGVAASVTNCSFGTNVTLRYGGTREDYHRINATMPSIWEYAKKAGLRTVYIDAQRTGRNLHNGMNAEELKWIDEFIQFDTMPVRHRDMGAADEIAKHLNNKTTEFIFVNKVGAHFPVHDKYPDAYMRYKPALSRGRYDSISDTGSRAGFSGSPTDWQLYRNAYRNTLLWNVGSFFERLFSTADLSKATLIYTSDHGQDLRERGKAGTDTHCASDPVMEEGTVPLVVISGRDAKTLDWNRYLAKNENKTSHYHIFPTLLSLMGFDALMIRKTYGAPISDLLDDPLTFNTRFNAHFGMPPLWRKIDPTMIAMPPDDSQR